MPIHLTPPVPITPIHLSPPPLSLSETYNLPNDFLNTSSSSSLRNALLATSRQLRSNHHSNSDSSQEEGHYIVPQEFIQQSSSPEKGQGGGVEGEEEELNEFVWNGSKVTWRVFNGGGTVFSKRSWDYSELGENVRFVRVVQFKEEPNCPDASESEEEEEVFEPTREDVEEGGKEELWGPYRNQTMSLRGGGSGRSRKEWSDEVLKLPIEPPFPPLPSTSTIPSSSSSSSSPTTTTTTPTKKNRLKPHLIIVLSTLAFLHPLSSFDFTSHSSAPTATEGQGKDGSGGIPIHLPFKLESIHSLESGGILFERAREGKEVLLVSTTTAEEEGEEEEDDDEEETRRVPVWWTLSGRTGGYGELKPLLVITSPMVGEGQGEGEEGQVMKDLEEKLVWVSNDFRNEEGSGFRVGVSVNRKKGKVVVWRYERIEGLGGGEGEGKKEKEKEKETMRGEGSTTMNLAEVSPKTGRKRKSTRKSVADLSSTLSQYSDNPNRSNSTNTTTTGGGRRRSARLSHLNETNDLLLSAVGLSGSSSNTASLPHSPHPLHQHHHQHQNDHQRPSLRRSHTANGANESILGGGGGLNSPENRRTSLTRNDLSVTMDRMALSQGSSVGGGGGGPNIHAGMLLGLGGGETMMDREATVYLGEEEWVDRVRNEGEGSEWRMRCVWEGELDGTSPEGIRVDLFDKRSPTKATLSILLPAAKTLLLLSIELDKETNELKCEPIKQIEAKGVAKIIATRPEIRDLLVLREGGTGYGLVTAGGMELDVGGSNGIGGIDKLESNGGNKVLLVHGKIARENMKRRKLTSVGVGIEQDGLGQKVFETIAQVLGTEDFGKILEKVLRGEREGFEGIRETFEEMFGIDHRGETQAGSAVGLEAAFLGRLRKAPTSTPRVPSQSTRSFTSTHYAILLSLHLLVQSLRLRISTLVEARELAQLVVGLASAVGARGWVDEYRRTWGPELSGFGQNLTGSTATSTSGLLPKTPPNILTHLYNLLSCPTLPDSGSFSLSSVANLFSTDSPSSYYGDSSSPLSTLESLIEIYALLAPSSSANPVERAHRAIIQYHELGYTAETLKDLPFGISLPIREAMRTCQLDPPERGLAGQGDLSGLWDLVGRRELERFPKHVGQLDNAQRIDEPVTTLDIDALVQQVERSLSTAGAAKTNVEPTVTVDKPNLNPILRAARFNEDKRMDEVARMLQYVDPVVIAPGEKTLDQLTPQVQQSILSALSHRTFALPVGAAMYHLASLHESSSDSLEIPKINTSARIIPMPSPVALAEKERDPAVAVVPERSEWPDFHSGVAAALRLSLDGGRPIDPSQLSFNRPADLDARHAGLLLGLGLNGQLGSMLSSQAYDYLKAKHDPTSVAILLGLAVTYLGTSDPTVTSVISIHLPALHPPRSSSLNVSGMTKSAAAVALGLLHFGTGRRSLSDVLVREMCGIRITSVEDAAACREAYALSCGFAFGFIMLGQGGKVDSATSSNEIDLLRVFRALILGENNRPLPGAFYPASSSTAPIDVNITSPAATIGLALMFIRTERQDVANIFEIPDSPRRLDYVRSDVLLLRTLGQSLVMWNAITPSKEWIESSLPRFLADADPSKPMDPDWEVARWSIIAGACFAVGFKFAGTATAEAHATLIHYMDRLTRACYVKAMTVQSKIKRHSLRTCLGVVSIALAMVMAGTGELNVLRRLRVAHGHFSEGLTYGYHLSTHMALGLLFLGEAKYTLSNSDGAIAALLLALYPVFPSTSTDNRAHLQAYRHLWVLAAEPRYLEARDIDSNEPVFLPVRLRLLDPTDKKLEVKAKQLVAPTLIPDVRLLDSIQVESPRYWGFTIRLAANPDQFSRFLRNSTLYVKRRTGHLSYAQDPRGIRSIFTRSKSETGSAVYDFGETTRMLNPSASGLRDFVAAFSDDPEAIAATEQLCIPPDANRPPSSFEAFCASVLLECLTKDKRDIASVYNAMFHANSLLSPSLAPSTETLFAAEQLRFVVDFYKRGIFKALFGKSSSTKLRSPPVSSSSREPLLNPAFIDHVSQTLSSSIDSISSSSPTNLLSTYLTFPGTWPTSATSTVPLALQLAQHSVPDLPALEQLHRLVRAAKRDNSGTKELELVVRCTAATIENSGKKAWSKQVSQMLCQN